MTNDGQSEVYSILEATDGVQPDCNVIFFGVISEMNFDMVVISSSSAGEGISIDNTYCANVTPIPTMSQWTLFILGLCLTSLAVVRIKKVALA